MSKRIPEIAGSLEDVDPIRVTDRGFIELLNTDLKDLEIASSLRKLGNTKVMEWDFKDTLPAVHKLVHKEVDLVGWMKRVAHYKVMDWDLRNSSTKDEDEVLPEVAAAENNILEPEEMQELIGRLTHFLQFIAVNLIDEPGRAQFRVKEITPGVLRFRLVVTKKDQKNLVGKDGATASALRNMLKGTAAADGVQVLLQILSHEEDLTLSLKEAEEP
ncbi:MAG: hypothetical protein EOP83_22295 [Verrucomicrobiaceae bacterium]|nr:MAG: hypothetical protein EOP83_22295 [Verrucomicrobiaceae bacterium]